MKIPKVSICIPAYDQVDYLKKNIDSVLSQTYTDYEIIITDDSPSDIVKDFIQQYQQPDIIKYYKNDTALGSPENWNECIRRASGEYIKILHHDDYFSDELSLAKYVGLLDNNPGADFAFSATLAIEPGIREWEHRISNTELEGLKKDPLLLYRNNIIGAPSTTIIRNNPELRFDRNLKWHVDIEYYIRQITRNAKIAYSSELLVVTFLAEGRVSDECKGNKKVEVFEYFYLLGKIAIQRKSYSTSSYKNCILRAIKVCKDFEIKSLQDIRDCGYYNSVPNCIRLWLFMNSLSSSLGKLYLKFLRNI